MDSRARFIAELTEWVAIPSVSSDGADTAPMFESAEWMADFLVRSGATARVERIGGSAPFTIGHMAATGARAPTLLIYGHHDVQPVGDVDLWESDPFVLERRGEWLHGRGSADDKGNLLMIMDAARTLNSEGRLGVNLLFFGDGEEEIGGDVAARWLRQHDGPIDACLIFDAPMPARGMPALCLGTRGLLDYSLAITTGEQDLHSGVFGGAASNAGQIVGDLLSDLANLVRTANEDLAPADATEIEGWQRLPDGDSILRSVGASPQGSMARFDDFYRRTLTQHSLDVHSITAGSPDGARCVLHAAACRFSVRVAAGADPAGLDGRITDLIGGYATGSSIEVTRNAIVDPSSWDPASEPIRAARKRLVAGGLQPVDARIGGSFALAGELAGQAIPTAMTGFDVPEGNAHAPNERLFVPYIDIGTRVAEGFLGDASLFNSRRSS